MSKNNTGLYVWKSISIIIFIGLAILAPKCQTVFLLDTYTAYEVSMKIYIYLALAAFFIFATRNIINFTTQLLILLPCNYFWIEPILDFKANYLTPNVPFYLSGHGQSFGFILVCLLCFALWIFNYSRSN